MAVSGALREQQAYIERVANPRTPQDLILALQNPATPAYKKMMELINEGIAISIVIEILIKRYIIHQHEASQKEKDEIIEMLARGLSKEKIQQMYLVQYKAQVTLALFEPEELKIRLDERANRIEKLEQQSTILNEQLNQLNNRARANTKNWQQRVTRDQAKHYTIRLVENNVNFVTSDGTVISPDSPKGKEICESAFALSSPQKLLNVLAVATPSEIPYRAKEMRQKSCVIGELNLINKLTREGKSDEDIINPKDILNVLNANREACKFLPGATDTPASITKQSTYSAVVKRKDAMARYVKSELELQKTKNLDTDALPNINAAQSKAMVEKEIKEFHQLNGGAMGSDLLRAIKQQKLKAKLEARSAEDIQPIQPPSVTPAPKRENKNGSSSDLNERERLFAEAIKIKEEKLHAKAELKMVKTQLKKEQSQQSLEMKVYAKQSGQIYKKSKTTEEQPGSTPSLKSSNTNND